MKDAVDTLGDEAASPLHSYKKKKIEIYGNEFVLRDRKDLQMVSPVLTIR